MKNFMSGVLFLTAGVAAAETVEVSTVAALKAALATVEPDLTIQLADNTYEIDETLYVTNGMTLVGTDRAKCVLKCVKSGLQPLVYLADGTIRNLTVTDVDFNSTWKNGGGVCVASPGGEIDGCAVINNKLLYSNVYGGGIYSSAKTLIQNSVISNNVCGRTVSYDAGYGGGICFAAGSGNSEVRNCLIAGNFAKKQGGGILFSGVSGIKVVNCTFAGNSCLDGAGAFQIAGGGATHECFVNCLFAKSMTTNGSGTGMPCWSGYSTQDKYRSYSTSNCFDGDYAVFGESPTQGVIGFADAENGDYHLGSQDCARDAGVITGDTPSTDLDGVPLDEKPDAGCFQYVAPTLFACYGGFSPAKAFPDVAVTLVGSVENAPDDAELDYAWTLVDAAFRTNVLYGETVSAPVGQPGRYTVSLSVTATKTGEPPQTVGCQVHDTLKICARTNYVTSARTDTAAIPYDRPDTAATNWFDVVEELMDGSTVVFDAGVHELEDLLSVTGQWTVVGQGIDRTVLQAANNRRCVYIHDPGAKVMGMTIRGGRVSNHQYGANVNIGSRGGALENCRVTAGLCPQEQINAHDAGVYVDNAYGSVVNCIIDHNTNGNNNASAAAVDLAGAGTVRNCLIWANVQAANKSSVGVIRAGGQATIESCTVVGNFSESTASNFVALLLDDKAKVWNNIFALNDSVDTLGDSALGGVPNWRMKGAGLDVNVTNNIFCGSTSLGDGCKDASGLRFLDDTGGDFRQRVMSSGVNSGVRQDWMLDAVDLDGSPRVHGRRPDLGCYECQTGYGLSVQVR